MSALDSLGDTPEVETQRAEVRAAAAERGLNLVSIEITHEPMPDPAMDALPPKQRDEILSMVSRIHDGERDGMIPVLESLIARHPHIPVLHNYLSVVLIAAGDRQRANRVIAETMARFPTYIFAFCNHVRTLMATGKIDEVRALLETGPRGPMLHVALFDPSRKLFHFTEVISYTATVGHYMIATGRSKAADTALRTCNEIDPDHPQTIQLAERLGAMEVITKAIARLSLPTRPGGGRPKKKARK
jgi:hypothetical protein